MFQIDQYAYSNRLLTVHPGEKLAFAVITMIICLISQSLAALLAAAVLMAGAVILAGIPLRVYLKLMTVPASFLVIAVGAVAVSISGNGEGYLWGVDLGRFYIGIGSCNLDLSILLLCRSLGAISCLYFLSLTTPMVEVISILRKLRVPPLFIELMGLIYRFIFVLVETAESIYTSQSSRLGYRNLKTGYSSLGILAANLLVRAYRRSEILFTTLSSRGYTGEIRVLETQFAVSGKNILAIMAIDVLLILLSLAEMSGGGLIGRIYN
ncbi:MAG: cobalt ECF transporter T component CbiQ [Actinobacteria bacterium]|nr:cobalt ECF transporter T component CbiQ [Actinomycetota bacterium]